MFLSLRYSKYSVWLLNHSFQQRKRKKTIYRVKGFFIDIYNKVNIQDSHQHKHFSIVSKTEYTTIQLVVSSIPNFPCYREMDCISISTQNVESRVLGNNQSVACLFHVTVANTFWKPLPCYFPLLPTEC